MKNLLSILLIAIFLSAQYARQFAYLQCRLATMGTTGLQDCGCGQVSDIDKLGEDGHPFSKNHTHLTLDEFFAQPAASTAPTVLYFRLTTPQALYIQNLSQGSGIDIDRPPQAA